MTANDKQVTESREKTEMRRVEFSIEDNGPMIEIGKEYEVTEYLSTNYFYMLQDSLGMSAPIPLAQRLKSRKGVVVEKKNTPRSKIAVLEFPE